MNSCQKANAFLSQFKPFLPKQKTVIAYEVQPTDKCDFITLGYGVLHTLKGNVEFTIKETHRVCVGDYVVLEKFDQPAKHWTRKDFHAANYVGDDIVVKRGDAVFEEGAAPGDPLVCSTVIKIKDRYFIEIKEGRVLTAAYINGATRFSRLIDEDKKRNKALAELTARKRNPQLLEIGFWSREVAEVQGGAV